MAFPLILSSFYTNDVLRSILLMLTSFPSILVLILVYYEARNQIRKIKTRQISSAAAATFLKERKAFRTTKYLIGVVLLCYIPNGSFRVVFVHLISSPQTFLATESFMLTLLFCNSALNPVIYCARSREYRRAFKKLISRESYAQPV